MWENSSPRNSKFRENNSVNSASRVLPSSPMVTRQRTEFKTSTHTNRNGPSENHGVSNQNVLAGAGPLLCTPFMPQIKRALGLEPKMQTKYGDRRRHSFGIGKASASPTVPAGSLPHVRLTKTRRLSLSERNSSMLNKSSTVKIAPPVIGKVASPSLYHMRCNTSLQEDRSTPDTYAVISALKERRKRSINAFDDHTEPSMQQAKRRRQESQHSNASTSSIPSMPENFPDLTNADFRMRLDTPGLKRPSRPSQDDIEEWDNENTSKRHRLEARNNSILSSLSSSQRFIENQKSRRNMELSFYEKENSYVSKLQRQEPPKLTHLDIPYSVENAIKTPSVPVKEKIPQMTNGHSLPTTQKEVDTEKSQKKTETSDTLLLRKMPTMKKTASIYSGLGSPASFQKVQYANVVATLDDYDADKEAEKRRVKQMLQDLDESFTKKEAKPEPLVTSTSTLPTSTVSVSMAKTSFSMATTASSLTLDTSKTLSALEKLSKSPVQETGGKASSATTQPSVSFKPLFGLPSSAQSSGSSASSSLQTSANLTGSTTSAGNFSLSTSQPAVSTGPQSAISTAAGFAFSLQKTIQSAGGLASSIGGVATTSSSNQTQSVAASGFKVGTPALGIPASTGAGGLSFAGASSTTATPSASTLTTTAVGLGFGSINSSTVTAPAPGGFSLSKTTAQPSSTSAAPAPFLLGSQPASTASAAKGFSFGGLGSTGASTVGLGSTGASTVGLGSTGASTVGLGSIGASTGGLGSIAASTSGLGNTGASTGGLGNTGASTGGLGSTGAAIAGLGSTGVSTASLGSTGVSAGGFPFGGFGSTGPTTAAFGNTGVSTASIGITGASTGGLGSTGVSAGGFSFGGMGSTGASTGSFGSTAASTGGFSFGGNASTAVTTVASSQFGTVTTASGPTFNFGAAASKAASGLFSAGSGTVSAPASGFAFGANTAAPAVSSVFGTPAANTIQSPFGATVSASQTPFGTSSTGSSTFNFNAVKTTATASPFSFNAGTATSSTGSTPFQTGQATGSTPAATGLFQFGGTSATSAPAFGATSTQPSVFGTTSQTPAFGGASQPPAFGANPAPAFGSTNQTPAFGSANQTPAFGTVSQTPAFGSASQTPAFGSTSQTPAFGSTSQTQAFGSASQTPTFGAQNQTQPPAYGAENQTSAFGAGKQTLAFGSASQSFGAAANQQSSTPVFGATTTSTVGSVFGITGNTVTGFAKSHSTPAFSTSQDNAANTGTFNFGGTAPNVNPFGQTTPAKQTGAAFGQVGSDTTPKSQTGSMFQFGQTNNNSAVKGFDFSASTAPTGGSGAGGFNFMAAASSVPVFNFGATGATPTAIAGFGAPGSTPGAFSVGAGIAQQRPTRTVARAARSRRSQRK